MLPSGDVGEALRYAPSGAGVLVETLRDLATRGTSTSTSGKGAGEGVGARVAVRSVLEDHETAVLELERVVSSIEDRVPCWTSSRRTCGQRFLSCRTGLTRLRSTTAVDKCGLLLWSTLLPSGFGGRRWNSCVLWVSCARRARGKVTRQLR